MILLLTQYHSRLRGQIIKKKPGNKVVEKRALQPSLLQQYCLDVSILLLLTNRYNKGILLHFCQQNGKKIAKLKILTKPSGNGLKNILGQKIFLVPRPK